MRTLEKKASWLAKKDVCGPVSYTNKRKWYQPLLRGSLLYICHCLKFFKLRCQENMGAGQM